MRNVTAGAIAFVMVVLGVPAFGGPIVYVDDSAPLGGDGQAWATAYKYLEDALTAAAPDTEIRVGGGDHYAYQHEHPSDSLFSLVDGTILAGGYAGYGAPDPDQRDIALYPTQLRAHMGRVSVLVARNVSATIDGITLRDANNGGTLSGGIGGFEVTSATVVARDCTFTNNIGRDGGAIGGASSTLTLEHCRFVQNSGGGSTSHGGAIAVGGLLVLRGCLFERNGADLAGGALDIGGEIYIADCIFDNNLCTGSYPQTAPSAIDAGGTGYVVNCLFVHNTSYSSQGAVVSLRGITLANSTLVDNTPGPPTVRDTDLITNCILRNGGYEIDVPGRNVTYCNVEGGYGGAGNIDLDPLFVNPAAGDYHLGGGSPCIDAASNFGVPEGVLHDLDGRPRFIDDPRTPDTGLGEPPIVDMGCYEFQAGHLAGDMNCDGAVDFGDVNPFVLAISDPAGWQAQHPGCPLENGDINGDGAVNFGDINPFVALLVR